MDSVSTERLSAVHPKLAALITQLDQNLQAKGIQIRVVQGLRTIEQQNALYAEGRTAPGEVVTNARGGYSAHNFGYAVDVIPGLRGKDPWEPNWNAEHPDFQTMIDEGVALGLESGAHWQSIKDEPHFQLSGLPITPTDSMRELIAENGLEGFWAQFITGEGT